MLRKIFIKILPSLLLLPVLLLLFIYGPADAELNKVFLDADENIYFVLSSGDNFEIRKASPDGRLTGSCFVRRFFGYDYTLFYDMTFSAGGKAYCALAQINSLDYKMTRHRWLEMDFNTNKTTVIYEEDYGGKAEPAGTALLKSQGILKSVIYSPGGLDTGFFGIYSGSAEKRHIDSQNAGVINGAAFYQNKKLLITNVLGEVFISANGGFEKIYSGITDFCQFKTDLNGGVYFYFPGDKTWKAGEIKNGALEFEDVNIKSVSLRGGSILDKNRYIELSGEKEAVLYRNGTVKAVPVPPASSENGILLALALWAAVSSAYILILFIIKKLKLTISLLFRQAFIIIAVLGAGIYVLSGVIDEIMIDNYEQSVIMTMRKTIHKMENKIDTEKFFDIDWSAPQDSEYYYTIRDDFSFKVDISGLLKISDDGVSEVKLNENYYTNLMVLSDGRLYTAVYDNEYVGTPLDLLEKKGTSEQFAALISKNTYDGIIMGFGNGDEWVRMIVPVLYENGGPAAFIECGLSMRQYEYDAEKSAVKVVVCISLLIGVAVLILTAGLWISLRPLKKLKRGVERVGFGDYSLSVKTRGNNEITKISGAFNEMSRRINEHTKGLEKLNAAYYRFLPSEVLYKLGRESVLSLNRGDNKLINAVILYISVANFDKVAAGMEAGDAFAVYNNVCKNIMETVIENGGFTESCNQSEFICLFENEDAAYNASLSIRRKLGAKEKTSLSVTLALLKGEILIGIAGDERRLCTFAISKNIKLAKALAEEGCILGAGTVCGEGFENIRFKRYLGKIVSAKEQIGLYDCYEGDETEIMQSKDRLSGLFEKGVGLFENSQWKESKTAFIEYLKLSVPDTAARRYLFLCENNLSPDVQGKGGG